MPVEAPPAVGGSSTPVATPQPVRGENSSFDARWEAWIERGRQHDLAVQRTLRIALLCAVAIGVLVAIFSA